MGKSQTRGRWGLYLKGKGVVRVQDFVSNLISNRIGDSFRFHLDFFDYSSVLFLCPEVFTEHGMRPGWHGLFGRNGAHGWLRWVGDGQHKAGRRERATAAMARRHCAQAVATATGPALALSWAREDSAGWARLE
jgi:hypothetical protein